MVNKEELLGRVVYSKAGRDSGRAFIVSDIIDKEYVYVIDGDLRKIEKPKKKKVKHLNITDEVIKELKSLIISKSDFSNGTVRSYLENRHDNKEG